MKKKKLDNLKTFRFLFWTPVFILVLLVASKIYFSKVPSDTTSTYLTPTSGTDNILKDNTNDGTYTSYLHGFSFEYPNEVFVDQTPVSFYAEESVIEDVCWYNQENNDGSPMGLNQETGVWMCLLAFRGDRAKERFDNEYNQDPKNSPRWGVRSIKRTQNDLFKQYIVFAKTPEGRETEHSVSYSSGWLTNEGLYISIFIAAGEDKEVLLSKYKTYFDKTVSSMSFSK